MALAHLECCIIELIELYILRCMKIENDYQYEDFEQNQNNKNTTPKNLNAKVRQHRVHTNMFMEVQFFLLK